MNKIEFQNQLKQYFPWVSQTEFDLFEKYKQIVQQKNQVLNLTRLDDESKIYEEFFLDSLLPYKETNLFTKDSNYKILDIGSGSGIPGIVLKIIFRNLKLTLLDSNSKKCSFLIELTQALGFYDVDIWHMRAEEINHSVRETFDIVTSRAVAELYKILEISTPFLKVNGHLIQPKSLKFEQENARAKNAIKLLNLKQLAVHHINETNHQHIVVVYLKTKKTDLIYPRSWAMISKKPL